MRSLAIGGGLLAAIAIATAVASASCSAFDASDDNTPPAQGLGDGSAAADQSAPDAAVADAAGIDAADATRPGPTTYVSCGDAQNHGVSVDGDILVDVDGAGPLKPFTIYCINMAPDGGSEPDEYLSLVNTTTATDASAFDSGRNVSGWAEGGDCSCADSNVVHAFKKVRIVLSATPPMQIVLDDPTFSATNRSKSVCETGIPACAAFDTPPYNFGVASGCSLTTFGRGNIDLTGTPFHVSAGEHGMANGLGPAGTTTYSTDRKVVDTVSGGGCGHQFPSAKSNRMDVTLD